MLIFYLLQMHKITRDEQIVQTHGTKKYTD
jgi:hypothetical protein